MNTNVQHVREKWFLDDREDIFEYLDGQKKHFWNKVSEVLINGR